MGYEQAMRLTPRQVHAYLSMRSWERRRELVAKATAIRMATNAKQKPWEKYIDALSRNRLG